MKATLRPFLTTDLPTLERWATTGDLPSYMGRWKPRSSSAQVLWWVILMDGREAGTIWLEKDKPADNIATLGILIGDPVMRGLGLGRSAIVLATEEAARQWQLQAIRLRVRLNNGRAICCYESLGFRETSRTERTLASGETIPVMKMERPVESPGP
ncbi:MAG: GNAT family N-acetyltransferase [Verrucomicrobiaceae bacterium]|nr:MAG: GNAT family N-acetyltransferase [Verrucomicrobiaceae bacterium]